MSGSINWENTIPVLSKICAKHFPAIGDQKCNGHGNTIWSAFIDGKAVEHIVNNDKQPVEDIEQLYKIANQIRLAIAGFEKVGPIGLNALSHVLTEDLKERDLPSIDYLDTSERIQNHLSRDNGNYVGLRSIITDAVYRAHIYNARQAIAAI